jgi:hypothetical protein
MIPHKRHMPLQVRRTIGNKNFRRVIHITKKTRKANNIFEMVNNPISFFEITDQYFPHSLPYPFHKALNVLLVNDWFSFNDFCNSKDIAESVIHTYKRILTKNVSLKQRLVFLLKLYVFIYKISWFILGDFEIHKDHHSTTIILDYINYFIGLITD